MTTDTPDDGDEFENLDMILETDQLMRMALQKHDVVPADELRELLKRWRNAEEYAEKNGYINESDGIGGCADELEALLADVEGERDE